MPIKTFLCTRILISFVFLWTGNLISSSNARAETIRVASASLQVGVDAKDGSIVELIDGFSGKNELEAATNPVALWEIKLAKGSLSAAQAKSFRIEKISAADPGLRLTWSGFPSPAAPNLEVVVTMCLEPGVASSHWRIGITNLDGMILSAVHFPRIGALRRNENESLAVPVWLGEKTSNPRQLLTGARREWSYPGHLSLQCLAFYQENGLGFYAACNDTAALRKSFSFWGDTNGNVHYEMVHYPERRATPLKNYAPDYASIVGTFSGDWTTAAERYRTWGTNQTWARESRLQKKVVPQWVLDTGMWVWNRGRSENVLEPAVVLQQELGLPVSVFWHWWHGCAYDTGFPEYLPPREGTAPFQQAVKRAHQQDVHAIVYMNQRLWGMTTKSWTNEGAEYFAVKNASGIVKPEVYNVFTRQPCASMCMDTAFWRDKYAGLAEKAIKDLKVDGIYMDQACSSLACYDPNHGHSLGGGDYWMDGFRKLSTDIRARTKKRSTAALAGEGCGEAWLPYLDIMLALQVARERYHSVDGWEVIPFFSAVYHSYAVLYGNYSSLTMPPYDDLWPAEFAPKEPLKLLDQKFSRQFYLEQARAFVWGQQPTIANFRPSHLVDRPAETEYMTRLAKVRNRATKFLLHGTFMRPPEVEVPQATLDLSRLSIYAGQKGGITSSQGEYPMALVQSWRASDGSVGFALASIAEEAMSARLKLDTNHYPARTKGTVYRIDERGRKEIGKWNSKDGTVEVALPARGACVIELNVK